MFRALDKIKKRIDEIITMDERLRKMLFLDIEKLEKQIEEIEEVPNQMHMMGIFFSIISRLLGYDWIDGKTYRTPIYFRTKSEEFADYMMRNIWTWREYSEKQFDLVLERHNIIKDLKNRGLKNNQIARTLNISEYAVRQVLKDKTLDKISELKKKGLNYNEIRDKLENEGFDSFDSLFREMHAAQKRLTRK